MRRMTCIIIVMALLGVWAGLPTCPTAEAADIVGHVMSEPIWGQPHTGYWHEYETYVFGHPENATGGVSRRVGVSGSNGEFSFTGLDTARNWSFVAFQPTFYNGVPCMIDRIRFHDGKNAPLVLNDPEYSCGNGDLKQWGANPWTWAQQDFYQTFVARSTSVRRVTVRVADNHSGRNVSIGIVADNGGAISTWPYVTPVGAANPKTIGWPGVGADLHVSWLSGQIPLTPGQRYAVRIHGVDMVDFSFYAHNSTLSKPHVGYTSGSVWADGVERPTWDVLGLVEGDADGKLVTVGPTGHYSFNFSGTTLANFGQTWTARGVGLAAVTLQVIVADPVESRIFTARVYDSPAKTTQIGPTKTCPGAWLAPNTACIGFSYCPGEIALTPGHQYYFEISYPIPGQVDLLHSWETYDGGQAYYNGVAQSGDLASYVVEYQSVAPPPAPPMVVSTANWLTNPGFESYSGVPSVPDATHFPNGIRPAGWIVTHNDANKKQEGWIGGGGNMSPGWNSVNALMNGQDEGGGYIGYKQTGSFAGQTARAFKARIAIAGEATNVGGYTGQMYEEPLRFRLSVRFLRAGALLETKSTGWVGFWGAERNFVPLELADSPPAGATDYEFEIEAVCYIPNNNGFPGEMNIVAIDDAFLTFDVSMGASRAARYK